MASIQPAVFVSHGAGPSFYLDGKTIPRLKGLDKDSKAADVLRNFVNLAELKRPEAILVLSAHWEETECTVQVSLLHNLNMNKHLEIAEALAPLRHDNILIVGSGFATHTIGSSDGPPKQWAQQFQIWLHDVFTNPEYSPEERKAKLKDYASVPSFSKAHPRTEHYLPLAMTCAATGYKKGKLLFSEFVGDSLLNEHYIFRDV